MRFPTRVITCADEWCPKPPTISSFQVLQAPILVWELTWCENKTEKQGMRSCLDAARCRLKIWTNVHLLVASLLFYLHGSFVHVSSSHSLKAFSGGRWRGIGFQVLNSEQLKEEGEVRLPGDV